MVAAAVRQHTAHTPLLTLGYVGSPNELNEHCHAIAARRGQVAWALMRAGVPVYAGSGGPPSAAAPGEALEHEVIRFASLGLSADQALATATTSPGRFWSDATYGQIANGLPGDVVLYRRDPTAALANLDSRYAVIADGRVYLSSVLDGWMARYRRFLDGPFGGRIGRDEKTWLDGEDFQRWMGGPANLPRTPAKPQPRVN